MGASLELNWERAGAGSPISLRTATVPVLLIYSVDLSLVVYYVIKRLNTQQANVIDRDDNVRNTGIDIVSIIATSSDMIIIIIIISGSWCHVVDVAGACLTDSVWRGHLGVWGRSVVRHATQHAKA